MIEMCSYGAGKYALRGESLDHTVGAAMSRRELDICFGLVSGGAPAGTGLKPGIGSNAVITYSRRSYTKPGVAWAGEPRDLLFVAARGPPRADCGEISDLFWRLT